MPQRLLEHDDKVLVKKAHKICRIPEEVIRERAIEEMEYH